MLCFTSRNRSARTSSQPKRVPSPVGPRFRPCLEGFEDRVVPAAPANLGAALLSPTTVSPASLLPVNITSATLDPATGAVTAVGTIGNQAITLLGNLSLTQNQGSTTPVLDLHINAIHLNLLGLTVDTSNICLNITASSGPGQLLGNLLSGLANSLNGGGLLPTLQNALSGLNLSGVTNELAQILNAGLGQLFSPASASAGSVTRAAGSTSILHLSLGPVNLSLLGLNVTLDNCANGPVTVDIGAQSGSGQLLGNLLTSVTHLLGGGANQNALFTTLNRVAGAIGNILNGL